MTQQHPSSSPLGPIHHVGYVVADLDAAIARLERLAATTVTVREVMDEQGVEAAMCATDGGLIELISPLDPEGAIARFLEKRGEGFHHVAFAVPDAAAALETLAARGAELIDTAPRRGLGGHMVAFVHPRSALGVLTEVVQDDDHDGR
jgi:methylmalonyl-CoA/ethylmalonyl-CoA epimerase